MRASGGTKFTDLEKLHYGASLLSSTTFSTASTRTSHADTEKGQPYAKKSVGLTRPLDRRYSKAKMRFQSLFMLATTAFPSLKPSGLSSFRSAKIDADIVARIERQKPPAGQINVQCRSELRLAYSSRRWITGKAHCVTHRWNEIAVRSPFED
jgi:hypothetical protein